MLPNCVLNVNEVPFDLWDEGSLSFLSEPGLYCIFKFLCFEQGNYAKNTYHSVLLIYFHGNRFDGELRVHVIASTGSTSPDHFLRS